MIRRATTLTCFFLAILTGISLYVVLKSSPTISHGYEWKMHKKNACYPTKQMRSDVQKDLWMSGERKRLHHRLISPHSILTAYPKGEGFELIEEMQGIKCYLQESLEEEKKMVQQIRFIESDSGTYHYSDHHFHAGHVFLSLFRLPGSALETEFDSNRAFLRGVAQDVSLSFIGSFPIFHAEKFKAHIHPQIYE